jgi:hypothetical protein
MRQERLVLQRATTQHRCMVAATQIQGRIVQTDAPSWEPIVAVLADELAAWFMWMFEVELTDGVRLHAYKHTATRRYLFVGVDGHAYAADGTGHYLRRGLPTAIAQAFVGWEPAHPCQRDIIALRAAVERARRAA